MSKEQTPKRPLFKGPLWAQTLLITLEIFLVLLALFGIGQAIKGGDSPEPPIGVPAPQPYPEPLPGVDPYPMPGPEVPDPRPIEGPDSPGY